MRYTPRRRRGDEEHEGGGLPVIPLVVIVVFAGLLLGGLLAHFFGSRTPETDEAMSPPAVTPVPSPTPSRLAPLSQHRYFHVPTSSPKPSPRSSATPTPKPSPTSTPSERPNANATVAATQIPSTATSQSAPTPHAAPATTVPAVITASPAPVGTSTPPQREGSGMQTGDPTEVVRAYLYALARGNVSQARSYLASGSPEEPFMRDDARVGAIESSSNGDGTYLVTADVHAKDGNYRVTCTVAALPQGMLIMDHFYVKPR